MTWPPFAPDNSIGVGDAPTDCHCLCAVTHPKRRGICRSYEQDDIALVEMKPNPHARVVPMCAPCRAALHETSGGRQGEAG